VFSVSQAMLQSRSGGSLKPSTTTMLPMGSHPVEIVGPLLPDEGLAVFDGYTFVPKAVRHRQRHSPPDSPT
jgi:hypothetical protein